MSLYKKPKLSLTRRAYITGAALLYAGLYFGANYLDDDKESRYAALLLKQADGYTYSLQGKLRVMRTSEEGYSNTVFFNSDTTSSEFMTQHKEFITAGCQIAQEFNKITDDEIPWLVTKEQRLKDKQMTTQFAAKFCS